MFKVGDEVIVKDKYRKSFVKDWLKTGNITEIKKYDNESGIVLILNNDEENHTYDACYFIPLYIYNSPLYKALNEN